MKRNTFVLAAAAAVLALAACGKEPEATPQPVNPLVGTAWLWTYDTTAMFGNLHQEAHINFLTDSTGRELNITEYAYRFDTTYTFTYTFHPDVNGVEVYYTGSHLASYFRYHPESRTLTQKEMVFYPVEPQTKTEVR